MTPFFSSTPWTLTVGIFHFSISRPSKLNSMEIQFPFALCSGLKNTRWHAQDNTFKPVNIDIFFLQTFANFRYITYFVSSLIPVWFQSHGLYSICSKYPFKHSHSTHKFSRIMHFWSHSIVAMSQILNAKCHNCQKNVTKLTYLIES